MIGGRYGRLKVAAWAGPHKEQGSWYCECDCGGDKVTSGRCLKRGHTKSCGCLNSELAAERLRKNFNRKGMAPKHGHSTGYKKSPTYQSWASAVQRCTNPKRKKYADYGGRGIKVSERWGKFENFLADMGERPDGKTLDRWPDNNGNYESDNCRWATPKEQSNNQRPRRY